MAEITDEKATELDKNIDTTGLTPISKQAKEYLEGATCISWDGWPQIPE